MKILGNTPEGDLIIQVSQAEWDGLQDGVRPNDDWKIVRERWRASRAYEILNKDGHSRIHRVISNAVGHGDIDGSIQSLRDIVDGKIEVRNCGPAARAKLKKLLDEQTK